MKARLKARIYGLVQGVGFRYFVKREARSLGITGWVRNMPDGSVEVIAEGEKNALKLLLSLLHKGPSFAIVDRVDYVWKDYTGEFSEFGVRY
ncbi:MAG: acylphosphatase [Synergistetes bacterium]|nr:acylphosphatase [Synergistota bacterium]